MATRPRLLATPGRPAYPDQETRKIVTAEILAARGFARRTEVHASDGEGCRMITLQSSVREAARWMDTLDQGRSLGDHLREVERRLLFALAAQPGCEAVDKPGRVIEAFALEIRDVPPSELGDTPRDPANGHLWTDTPWTCIEELYAFALREVDNSYGSIVASELAIDVSTRLILQGKAHAADVGAKTYFPQSDAATARCAEVVLEFPRETFDGEQYFALLVKIHHEIFVHAVQAIARPGRRECYGEACPLAEGFMDRAAYFALCRALDGGRLDGGSAAVQHRFRTRTDEMHNLRMSVAPPRACVKDRLAAQARIFGRDLFDLVMRERGGGLPAAEWVVELAMHLNLGDLRREERQRLLTHIHGGLTGSQTEKIMMLGALASVVNGGDPRALLP